MIKTLEQLQEFIIWAKDVGIKRVKTAEVEFELSDVAVIEKHIANESVRTEPLTTSKTMVDTEQLDPKEEDELLYWSSQ